MKILTNTFPYFEDKEICSNTNNPKAITSLLKDISDLLNSKPAYPNIDDSYGFVISYGLPDLSYYSPYSKQDQIEVSNIIRDCLIKFEPRLQSVSVIPIIQEDNYGINFYFKITAVLRLLSESMSLILESKIDVNSKKVSLNLAN